MSCQKRVQLYRTGPDLILRPEMLTNGRIMMSLDVQNGATSISHAKSYGPIAPITSYYPGKPTRHVDHFLWENHGFPRVSSFPHLRS
jgi:hypothetical protein